MIALILFQAGIAYGDSVAQQKSQATLLATSEIESLRDFNVLNTQVPYAAYQNIASGTSNSTVGNTTYTLTWTVTAYVNPTYKTIDISVTWTDRRAIAQSIRLITMVAGIDPPYSAAIM